MNDRSVSPTRSEGQGLVQLLYRSTSAMGVTSALQMSDILSEARPRNAELGVTGVLTAVDGQFVQIIEGPEDGIDALMAKLVRDRRHTEVRVLEIRSIRGRAFAEWDMVSPRLAGVQAAHVIRLLASGETSLDVFIPVLRQAITRQDAVLEGIESAVCLSEVAVSEDETASRPLGAAEA